MATPNPILPLSRAQRLSSLTTSPCRNCAASKPTRRAFSTASSAAATGSSPTASLVRQSPASGLPCAFKMSDAGGVHRAVPTDEGDGRAAAPLSAGAIAGIVCAVIVVVVLLAALAYCIYRRKRKAAARRAQVPPASPPRSPVTPPLVRAQQTDAVTGGHHGDGAEDVAVAAGDDGLLCGMCRSGYDIARGGAELPETLECGHRFHRRCVRPWLPVNLACPTCNATHILLCGEADGQASMPSHRL